MCEAGNSRGSRSREDGKDMATSHCRDFMVIRLQPFDEKLFRGDAECALVLNLSDPGLLHVCGTEHGFFDDVGDIVVNPAAQEVSFPAARQKCLEPLLTLQFAQLRERFNAAKLYPTW